MYAGPKLCWPSAVETVHRCAIAEKSRVRSSSKSWRSSRHVAARDAAGRRADEARAQVRLERDLVAAQLLEGLRDLAPGRRRRVAVEAPRVLEHVRAVALRTLAVLAGRRVRCAFALGRERRFDVRLDQPHVVGHPRVRVPGRAVRLHVPRPHVEAERVCARRVRRVVVAAPRLEPADAVGRADDAGLQPPARARAPRRRSCATTAAAPLASTIASADEGAAPTKTSDGVAVTASAPTMVRPPPPPTPCATRRTRSRSGGGTGFTPLTRPMLPYSSAPPAPYFGASRG